MIKLSKPAIAICFFVSSAGYASNPSDTCLSSLIKQEYRYIEEELDMIYTIARRVARYNDDTVVEGDLFQRIRERDPEHLVLEKAQLAWVKMRATSCDYETYASRIAPTFDTIYTQCLIEKTLERIEDLKIYGGTPIPATRPLEPFQPRETRKRIRSLELCQALLKDLKVANPEQP
ncbi:lysozyme inhibitor LprI family protein [Serratia microhaemolytica]|uniref:lysozyme inhibitor LprI family protein n=1 Tax=Serratia microhaemolytica TaxID=2675110 RepID=UPI0013923BA7|nr:lysozyme inhibitor LprI family protein [Serratia microhaemolytica]